MMSRRIRVLVSANTVDGGDLGESWTAFKWIDSLRQFCDITLVTLRTDRKVPLENQLPGIKIIQVNPLPLVGRFARFNSMAKPSFIRVYLKARRLARQLAAAGQIDLCHSITPEALRYPSPFPGLGIPFVHGPAGGSVKAPGFLEINKLGEPWFVRLRILDQWRFKWDPILRRTIYKANRFIAIGRYVADNFDPWPADRAIYMTDSGIEKLPPLREDRTENPEPVILFAGRLVPSKGAQWMIQSLARIKNRCRFKLVICGQGIMKEKLVQWVSQLGLSDRTDFIGQVSIDQLHEEYKKADIFCLPSVEETSGCALLEAMSYGLPCVVAGLGGPREILKPECGAVVRVKSLDQFIEDMALALERLVISPEVRKQAGQACRHEIEQNYLWSKKVESLVSIYQSILIQGGSPDYSDDKRDPKFRLSNANVTLH